MSPILIASGWAIYVKPPSPPACSHQNSWSRRIGEVSTSELLHTLSANTVAPFVLCGALRSLLAAPVDDPDAPYGHIINVSALEGKFSVGKKGSGHPHTNMSKAALNMLVKNLALELARTHPQAIAVTLHPGTVDTGLSAPFQRGVAPEKLFTPAHSAAALLRVLHGLTPAQSGGLFAWDGARVPF